MRLTKAEHQAIRRVVHDLTGGRGRAVLFGSRLRDEVQGGDIDLLIDSPEAIDRPAQLAARIGAELEISLGEQRIDVLIGAPNLLQLPIHAAARRDGVVL